MKKLYTYMGRYWYGYLFAIFCMVAAIVLDMVYPKITQQIVDDVILGGELSILTGLLVGIVIVGIGRCIFGYCKEFTFDVLASKIGSQMRKDLFDHVQSLSMGYFEKTNTGELMARVKDDIDKIWNAMAMVENSIRFTRISARRMRFLQRWRRRILRVCAPLRRSPERSSRLRNFFRTTAATMN